MRLLKVCWFFVDFFSSIFLVVVWHFGFVLAIFICIDSSSRDSSRSNSRKWHDGESFVCCNKSTEWGVAATAKKEEKSIYLSLRIHNFTAHECGGTDIDWMSWLFICLSHSSRFYWKPLDFSQHWRCRHCGFPMLRVKIPLPQPQRSCRRSTVVHTHTHTQTTPNGRVIAAKRKFPVYPNICLFYFHCTVERPKTTAPAMPAWIYLFNKYADIFCRIFAHRLTTTTTALG